MKKLGIFLIGIFLTACQNQPTPKVLDNSLTTPEDITSTDNQKLTETQPMSEINPITAQNVILKTSKGDINLKLYPEAAPKTVANFLEKSTSGYYENLTFHRVEKDFVIQGGDPLGNGTGGGDIPTELSQIPFTTGSLGVARAGNIKISNDSQFFICLSDNCRPLTGQYTNFGEVTDGMDVVEAIAIGDKILSIEVVTE